MSSSSLITGMGGGAKWEGGHVKFYPLRKGGGGGLEKSFSHAEEGGGAHTVLGQFLRGSC